MFRITLTQWLVVLGVVFLFGAGYYFYNSHVEFRDVMNSYVQFEKTYVDTETPKHNETSDSMALGKQELEAYGSYQKPVKIRYAETGMPDDEGVTTVPNKGPPKEYYKEDLVPQWVETPDGKVHKIYWFEKLKPGQAIPPPHRWSFTDKVIVDGVMYDVPEGETSDSYIDQIRLSTMYDVPLESVDSLVEEGVISSSPIEAENDPLFQDPHFVKREDSRPLEARSAWSLSDWGMDGAEWAKREKPRPVEAEIAMLDGELALIDAETGTVIMSGDELDETEGGSSSEIDSEQVPVADDFDNVLVNALEKPKLPQSMVAPKNQLTAPSTETDVTEGVSPEDLDKAGAQINQHSTEKRLRRLQELWESDPEVPRQFEQEHLRSERLRPAEPSRDAPDGEQSEQ